MVVAGAHGETLTVKTASWKVGLPSASMLTSLLALVILALWDLWPYQLYPRMLGGLQSCLCSLKGLTVQSMCSGQGQ